MDRPVTIVTNHIDSIQYREQSPQTSMGFLSAELMMVKHPDEGCNGNISQKLQDESTFLHLPASPLMYACPRLSLGAHGSYLSLCGSSGNQHCHTGSLLDHSHRVSLWPLVTTQGSSSREADLTHSPQCTATSHMPASPVILTQH